MAVDMRAQAVFERAHAQQWSARKHALQVIERVRNTSIFARITGFMRSGRASSSTQYHGSGGSPPPQNGSGGSGPALVAAMNQMSSVLLGEGPDPPSNAAG